MLLDVHRTGALFFDANSLNGSLDGHLHPGGSSGGEFIDRLPPDYPPRLRELVLQSSDVLMRSARIGGY